MMDYQELYYASQRKITNTIQILEKEIAQLKQFQQLCEEKVIMSDTEIAIDEEADSSTKK